MFWSSISLSPTAIASPPFPLTELFFPPLSPTPTLTPATFKLRSSSTCYSGLIHPQIPMQIMSIAFYKRVMRNGPDHIGYAVKKPLLLFFHHDEFVSLPPIVPEGPIAIYGLGGGTAAHLMLDVWPSLQLEGWEIDEILIDKAREYFGLSNLEKCNDVGGQLQVHIDDAFSHEQHRPSGYAGIIIDLFSDGKVLSQLQEVEIWLELSDRLMPGGRLMVNCGGVSESSLDGKVQHPSIDDIWMQNTTIKALAEAFPGQVRMGDDAIFRKFNVELNKKHKNLKASNIVKEKQKCKGVTLGELSPHPFAVVDPAYRQMINKGISLAILVSGENGVGKYLASLGGRVNNALEQSVKQNVLESNPALEAFDNTKTVDALDELEEYPATRGAMDVVWISQTEQDAAFLFVVNWKRMPESQGQNYLALTGPLPDLTSWSAMVPSCLSEAVKQWKHCRPLH
ncbi:hypothetical protein GOBAR_AA14996 [Gossypium barbadense]|uniref:Myosin motor domain-containing protein n=1 Tax=Gossypium barbadense TaxID=3634 RepID=A0A2P5XQM9_GOSBA|nr:hypothetical protein GOBAR_AA14996 [Gossypium barbadense]